MSRIARDLASSPHHALDGPGQTGMHRLCAGKLPRVAVVGAGVSGLRCAALLAKAGSPVTVFEARDRVGGRVHQVLNGGHLVDGGPNWIHGTQGNPMMRLAQATDTPLMTPEEGSLRVIDEQGNRLSAAESHALSAEFWGMILKAFRYSDEASARIDVDANLADWLRAQWSAKFVDDPTKVARLEAMSKMWGQFVGSPIERQSLKFFFLEEGLDGENVLVAGTYRKILDEVAKPVFAYADMRLNTEVRHVRYRSMTTTEDVVQTPVTLTTADGTQHEFDEVVVTCPLGWLKRNHSTAFSPPLPPRLVKAIDSVGYGALEKLYVSFPTAFWLGPNGHDDDDDDDPEAWPCFTDILNPQYHPTPSSAHSRSWNQSVVSLAHLPKDSAHPTLLFYMMGDSGAHLTKQVLPHARHSTTYNALLQSFAEPFYSRLPHFDGGSAACRPTSFYLTSWQHDRHAGHGSYTTLLAGPSGGGGGGGDVDADDAIETMRDAAGLAAAGRGLWLAGEHTAPFVSLGTTTGAWWSGEGVARRVARRYGLVLREEEGEEEEEASGGGGGGGGVANGHAPG